ncbi:uncharacterized protein FTOL_07720 [Fusarium torulosum]|uniref:RING-type domain-containing protein n=1 Tax=Fusarium torulosum TaxID=33205 RepID=A0AAE8SJ97_9HYPO|nr:uncharacterized protein FTOL_07720 [Fusarium torulosum]
MPHGEGFWPTIRQATDNNTSSQSNETMKLQCPICLDFLAVRATSSGEAHTEAGPQANGDSTLGEVLLCGHIICQPCRRAIESTENHSITTCPVCRAKLNCSRCGTHSLLWPIASTVATEHIPMTTPEGADHGGQCPECRAKVQFHEAVDRGEWPQGLDDTEPGFVQLFYHILNKLEQEGRNVSKTEIRFALTAIVNEEFDTLMAKREEATAEKARALREENNWFATLPPAIPRPAAVRMERTPTRRGQVYLDVVRPLLLELRQMSPTFDNERQLYIRNVFEVHSPAAAQDAEDDSEDSGASNR